jgi:hypothetical protein
MWLHQKGSGVSYLRDDTVLSDILSLVGIEASSDQIAQWTDTQCEDAEEWAACTHLRANDHYDVKVPKEPEFLEPYKVHGY